MPLEYGFYLPFNEQIDITNQGLKRINSLLDKYDIKATFFVTSLYAQKNPSIIKQIGVRHEIASHSHTHDEFAFGDAGKSKKILEEISQVQVNGFRMPRFGAVDYEELRYYGYTYDSSLNPTHIPGRYNNFFKPRKIFHEKITGLTVVPVSVTPVLRLPLFWLSFKNMPFNVYSFLCKRTLVKDKYLHLYFHSWEFADIKSFRIPAYLKRLNGDALTGKLEKLLVFLKKEGIFFTITEFLRKNNFGCI